MKAIILTNLTASAAPGDHHDAHGVLPGTLDEPVAGFFRHVKIGPAGLQMTVYGAVAGEEKPSLHLVAIPLTELLRLAEKANPAFVPASVKTSLPAVPNPAKVEATLAALKPAIPPGPNSAIHAPH